MLTVRAALRYTKDYSRVINEPYHLTVRGGAGQSNNVPQWRQEGTNTTGSVDGRDTLSTVYSA